MKIFVFLFMMVGVIYTILFRNTKKREILIKEEAIAWSKTFIKEMQGDDIIEIDMEILKDGDIIDKIIAGQEIEIQLIEQSGIVNGLYSITIVDQKLNTVKELDFFFKDGIARLKTILRESGIYMLCLNIKFKHEDKEFIVFTDKNKYTMKVI